MSNIDNFGTYLDPGVYIDEIPTPTLASVGVEPTIIALVGDSQRYRTYSEIQQLNGTTVTQLSKLGVNGATVQIKDRFTGQVYLAGSDYVTTKTPGSDVTTGTPDDVTSITRVNTGNIPDGGSVIITYQFTDPTYFQVYQYSDYDDVRETFGEPFTDAGVINSPLTLAAFLAFLNGASELVLVSVQATGPVPTSTEWDNAISKLNDQLQVNVVVPIDGTTSVHDKIQQHVINMENQGSFRRCFLGRDGTGAPVTRDDLKAQAGLYHNDRVSLVSPSSFSFYNGAIAGVINLGGQYAAAAVAGAFASRAVQEPLTRKTIRGFYAIQNQDTEVELVDEQRAGVLVLWQKRTGEIIVRHGVTTDMSNTYSREVSIQAAKDRLHSLLQDMLDSQSLIGSVQTQDTPDFVVGAVVGALEFAKSVQLIYDYDQIKYRIPVNIPTMMQIRFMYKPSLPLNYVQIQFGIDTQTGTLTWQDLTNAASVATA